MKYFKDILANISANFGRLNDKWHNMPAYPAKPEPENLPDIIIYMHWCNFSIWHEEDIARRRDIDATGIGDVKRTIDKFNQERNNSIKK